MAETITGILEKAGFSTGWTSTILPIMTWVGIILLILIIGGALAYFLYHHFRYGYKVTVFGKSGGRVRKKYTDRGGKFREGQAGDYTFRLKKKKRRIPCPSGDLDLGKEFWFYERADGELIPIGIEDIDEKLRLAKAKYIDEDMRLSRISIANLLKQRYDPRSWWARNVGTIMTIVFIVIIAIVLILLFREMRSYPGEMAKASKEVGEMAKAVRDMAEAIRESSARVGSGVVPAG